MTEFELIARYFDRPARSTAAGVRLGIGDDCALLAPAAGRELAVSTDLLVAGRHFFADVDPASLGWKTLAVNLSDLAAMGARPRAFTLGLALPAVDEHWLAAFASGLFECADRFECALVGGDTTRGPLTLSVTVIGDVAPGRAMRRAGARVGDDVWVSGTLGAAAHALAELVAGRAIDDVLRAALERPVPRVALSLALDGVAHAAIDVSDGLAQDLGHVLKASRCGAVVRLDRVPIDAAMPAVGRERALAGGDDYELCFTAAVDMRDAVERAGRDSDTRVTRIGSITTDERLVVVAADGSELPVPRGYDHFA